jgi:hypothetical protein
MAVQDNAAEARIGELGRRYMWWQPVDGGRHSYERIIAQAMNLGTFDDIRRLEDIIGPARLADVMLQAAPVWISDRSWEFWRCRLSLALGTELPENLLGERLAPNRHPFDSTTGVFPAAEVSVPNPIPPFP